MNGPQDAGGMMGFGPVVPENPEPVFHAPWEGRALAVTLAMGALGQWNIDMSRHARETLPPGQYWSSPYYEIWIAGLEKLIAERGLLNGAPKDLKTLRAGNVAAVLARGGPANRPLGRPAHFAPGIAVRTRNLQTPRHTRLPRYLIGCRGVVQRHHGAHVFPDSNGHGEGENPQHLYTVMFKASEVFGTSARDEICADLFEPYLEAT